MFKKYDSKVAILQGHPYLILTIILITSSFVSIFIGRYNISFSDVIDTIFYHIGQRSVDAYYDMVIWNIRIPRIILDICIGAGLAVAGCVYQGIFRNPLVDSYLLGVSSGAAFGAGVSIVLGISIISLPITALTFAILATVITYLISYKRGKSSTLNLILVGIVVNAIFTAGLSYLKTIAYNEQLRDLTFWLMGGLYIAEWKDVIIVLPITIIVIILLWSKSWNLNIMSMGDEEAKSLGLNVNLNKIFFLFLATLITAISVSIVGIISWVGLIIPHIVRIILGPDHKKIIISSALMGAIFIVICDSLARSLTSGELPISILTSAIGGPYLLYLIRKNKVLY
jgi:iron complex transport system permease protein